MTNRSVLIYVLILDKDRRICYGGLVCCQHTLSILTNILEKLDQQALKSKLDVRQLKSRTKHPMNSASNH